MRRHLIPWGNRITPALVLGVTKMACGGGLFFAPWVLSLEILPIWNLWICGYAILAFSLAAIVAEADWEPPASFCLGSWVVIAPWILGFAEDPAATFVHVVGGGLVAILSAALWTLQRNPPWRFQPGAAVRLDVAPAISESLLAKGLPAEHASPVARRIKTRRLRREQRPRKESVPAHRRKSRSFRPDMRIAVSH